MCRTLWYRLRYKLKITLRFEKCGLGEDLWGLFEKLLELLLCLAGFAVILVLVTLCNVHMWLLAWV